MVMSKCEGIFYTEFEVILIGQNFKPYKYSVSINLQCAAFMGKSYPIWHVQVQELGIK